MSRKEKSKPASEPTSGPSEKRRGEKSSCRTKKVPASSENNAPTSTASESLRRLDRGAALTAGLAVKPNPPKLRRRRSRIKLGEAMRKVGLDEHTIAETYAGVVQTLRTRNEGEGIEKLLVDVLKECTRVLEPPAEATDRSGETLVQVQLIHNVPRPERKIPPAVPAVGRATGADTPVMDLLVDEPLRD